MDELRLAPTVAEGTRVGEVFRMMTSAPLVKPEGALTWPRGMALPYTFDRADVDPSAGAVTAARNQIGEAPFVDLAQIRGHRDPIERTGASERDHALGSSFTQRTVATGN